jgi:hypothetical protein
MEIWGMQVESRGGGTGGGGRGGRETRGAGARRWRGEGVVVMELGGGAGGRHARVEL